MLRAPAVFIYVLYHTFPFRATFRGGKMGKIQDILRSEGIYEKGFGIIPKKVMTDPDLSADAKAIYAYFCSYAGAGESAFPGRDRIVSDLGVNKDSYYKHLKILTDTGLITVSQENQGGRGQGYKRNIYTLVSLPEKYRNTQQALPEQGVVSASGLKAFGYGTISKSVMTDPAINIRAKALYAYLCAFTGSGDAAFPRRDDSCYHLKLSKNTYSKYLAELVSAGLITVKQRRISGKLSVCDYYINEFIDQNVPDKNSDLSPCTNFSDTQDPPYTRFSDTQEVDSLQLPYTKSSDTQKPDTQISDTINNNIINNRIYNKQFDNNHHQEVKYAVSSFVDLLEDDDWNQLEKKYEFQIMDEIFSKIDDSFEGRKEQLLDIKHPLNYFKAVAKSMGY